MLNESDHAEDVIKQMEEKFAQARTELAALQGRTYQVAYFNPDNQIYRTDEALPEELGLKRAPDQPKVFGEGFTMSVENIEQLNAEILFAIDRADPKKECPSDLAKDPRFSKLPATKNNAVIVMGSFWPGSDQALRPSPQNVDWILENLVPKLKAASY